MTGVKLTTLFCFASVNSSLQLSESYARGGAAVVSWSMTIGQEGVVDLTWYRCDMNAITTAALLTP
eukprot:COSAG02_NODE_552_length_20429_cov_28.014068_10_plen_66_part_00